MKVWRVAPAKSGLSGAMRVPGDKSISHRALILSSIADGKAEITGLLESEDVIATRRVLAETIAPPHGEPPDGEPSRCDCGNSGTTIRLMMGLLAGRKGFQSAILFGDESLNRRPMERVAVPLRKMGASIETSAGKPPVVLSGRDLIGCPIEIDVASAQVKSALLLAGLHAAGETVVRMPAASRDHTERMLGYFSCPIESTDGGRTVAVRRAKSIKARPVSIPGDISSAAFFIVAAALVRASAITIDDVGTNPTRTGILDLCGRAGVRLSVDGEKEVSGEPRGALRIAHGAFDGFATGGDEIPRLIDEIPVIALLAAHANSDESVIADAGELRVKESDRLTAIVEEFKGIGLSARTEGDALIVPGRQFVAGGAINSRGDHRIAMTGAIAGLASREGVAVRGVDCVETSFPGFAGLLRNLGAEIEESVE